MVDKEAKEKGMRKCSHKEKKELGPGGRCQREGTASAEALWWEYCGVSDLKAEERSRK
jgi:hypothetical protein